MLNLFFARARTRPRPVRSIRHEPVMWILHAR
jgi:hypothetical protein